MAMLSRITELFDIDYPVISGGMVWCSGWELAAAVSNAGGLGLIGAGSMEPDVLRDHIIKCRQATGYTFGVNVPLKRPQAPELMEVIAEQKVPVVFTSAGSPKKWTSWLHQRGIKVAHVVSSSAFAVKCEEAGVDAVVAEGFEAGGHNGKEETTTMCLIPAVRQATSLPLIAAGGIGNGPSMLAAYALGAEGVQIGTRFALTVESSASEAFKNFCLNLEEGDTMLILKKLSPTRMAKNPYREQLDKAEAEGATAEQLLEIIGAGRNRQGIFEGDLVNGEVEIGQNASQFKGKGIQTVAEVMTEMLAEYREAKAKLIALP